MKWVFAVTAAASLWLASAYSLAADAAQPTASAFGRAPAMESLALSPSGQMIAWVRNDGARPIIQVLDPAGRAQVKHVDVPSGLKVHGLSWADEEILLIHADVEQTPAGINSPVHTLLRTIATEVATGKSRVLLHTGGSMHPVSAANWLALRTSKPHKLIISTHDVAVLNDGNLDTSVPDARVTDSDRRWGRHLFEVDALSGDSTLVGWGTTGTHRWVVDADGQAVARSEFRSRWKLYTVLSRRASEWVEIFRLETGEIPELLGLTRDGSALLMHGALGRKHLAIWRVPLDGSAHQLVIGDESDDVTNLVRDPYSLQVLGAWTGGLAPQVRWIDEQARKRAASLQKTFGGKHAALIGRSADETRAVVGVGAHATPVTYYLVDFKRGAADIIGEQYPELVDVPLGEVRALTFKARDGHEIPAYLTLPPGSQAAKLPLVVLPHDGPDARDETRFDPVAQFVATRGYAVLQPQFRGSTGFGAAHRLAGYRQWGGLMQDDVTDGVRAMIEQGIADPRRVCIAGRGYGGYVALAGAAFTPELYACAISVDGIADLPDLIGHVRHQFRNHDPLVEHLEQLIGRRNSPDIAAKSPARAAADVKAPILLLHGARAEVVPIAQSREMMKALGDQAPHELIELPGEARWLSDSATRVRVLTEMERFLAKHLPVAGQGGG